MIVDGNLFQEFKRFSFKLRIVDGFIDSSSTSLNSANLLGSTLLSSSTVALSAEVLTLVGKKYPLGDCIVLWPARGCCLDRYRDTYWA